MICVNPNFPDRLLCIEKGISSDIWDDIWSKYDIEKQIKMSENDRVLRGITGRFLEPNSKVLDGGSGMGNKVYCLQKHGYQAYGVDYAEKTVEAVKSVCPELNIQYGNIMSLPFEDNYFDGYWSFGVIEHFLEGYGKITDEMARVIRPEGYLFITFPSMNPLRLLKKKFNCYPTQLKVEDFYQFLLPPEKVIQDLSLKGFDLVLQKGLDAGKGLKDDVVFVKPFLQKCYNSTSFIPRAFMYGLSVLLQNICPHATLLVMKRNNKVVSN